MEILLVSTCCSFLVSTRRNKLSLFSLKLRQNHKTPNSGILKLPAAPSCNINPILHFNLKELRSTAEFQSVFPGNTDTLKACHKFVKCDTFIRCRKKRKIGYTSITVNLNGGVCSLISFRKMAPNFVNKIFCKLHKTEQKLRGELNSAIY